MKITEIKLNNFKAFAGEHTIKTDSSIVCLVGENNTGKTTVFAAVDFLKNGVPKERSIEYFINKSNAGSTVSVEVTVEGELTKAIEAFSEKKYLPYLEKNGASERLRLKRSSEKTTITQNGKEVNLDEKKLTVFNPATKQFENPSGFDRAIGSLLETLFIWSDMQPEDVVDLGATKTLGRLLKKIFEGFQESPDWKAFLEAHDKAFKSGDDALMKRSEQTRKQIQSALGEFYGQASVKFDFQPPSPGDFIKSGETLVDDGVETPAGEKGSGMQRALALAITKVYADGLAAQTQDGALTKPLFFFIDEPEISLHPKAQEVLVGALREIAKRQQVFLTTHSPLLLKHLDINSHAVLIFNRKNAAIEVTRSQEANTFEFSPTLAEINYFAYGLATIEFHNELYGYISEIIGCPSSKQLDDWLGQQTGIPKTKQWVRIEKGVPLAPENVTLMTYIRHFIHHPENKSNAQFTEAELIDSIEKMRKVIASKAFKSLKNTP